MSKLRMTFFNSAMTASKAQWPVLEQYYPHVFTLSNYLDALISSKPATWVTPNDSESFRHLIDSTVVASEHALDKIPKMPLSPPERSQSEVSFSSVLSSLADQSRLWTEFMASFSKVSKGSQQMY